MEYIQNKPRWIDIDGDALRQYIDARSAFTAWESARKNAAEVRGGMHWKRQGKSEYLIRTSVNNSQKSLGPRSLETETIYQNFIELKAFRESRVADLTEALKRHQRMNRALYVGTAPRILVDILKMLERVGLSDQLIAVGDCALYAYETAVGVRVREVDSLAAGSNEIILGPRKHLSFIANSEFHGRSFLKLLQKIDQTFQIQSAQPYVAVNSKGFAVEVIEAKTAERDPRPLKLAADAVESWAVLSNKVDELLSGPRFSTMIVASSGHMARMNTISPLVFVELKRWLVEIPGQDSSARQRDILQANIVEELVEEFLLHVHVYYDTNK